MQVFFTTEAQQNENSDQAAGWATYESWLYFRQWKATFVFKMSAHSLAFAQCHIRWIPEAVPLDMERWGVKLTTQTHQLPTFQDNLKGPYALVKLYS